MGAVVADNKCFTFANTMDVRKSLSGHVWNAQGLKIPCKSSFRDLGAHLNFTTSPNGATLTARMQKCIGMAKRLRWLPIAHEMKARLVSTNILPAALYGVEVTSINQAVFKPAICHRKGPWASISQKECQPHI
jgi:hypothetical protein